MSRWPQTRRRRAKSGAAGSGSPTSVPVDDYGNDGMSQFVFAEDCELRRLPWLDPALGPSTANPDQVDAGVDEDRHMAMPASAMSPSPSFAGFLRDDLHTGLFFPESAMLAGYKETAPVHDQGPAAEPQHGMPSPMDLGDKSNPAPDDPVAELSHLHLELYHCLSLVKAVQKCQKERLQAAPGQARDDGGTGWLGRLFHATERFVSTVGSFVDGPGPASSSSSDHSYSTRESQNNLASRYADGATSGSDTLVDGPDAPESESEGSSPHPAQADTATGFTIVSCYVRILQVFEAIVALLKASRDMDLVASCVEIRFGSFVPTMGADSLHARLLSQYMLHVQDGISEVVSKAVPEKHQYAQAVADIRRVEARVKESILSTLH